MTSPSRKPVSTRKSAPDRGQLSRAKVLEYETDLARLPVPLSSQSGESVGTVRRSFFDQLATGRYDLGHQIFIGQDQLD